MESVRPEVQDAHGTESGPEQFDGKIVSQMWSTWFNAVTMLCNPSRSASIRLAL